MGSYSFGTTVCAWPAMLDVVNSASDQRLHPPWWPHGLGTAATAIAISRETVQALKRANDTIANMDRLKKYMTREFASYVGRHMEHKYPETTKRNSSALSSTTCTTRTMYFSSNRRAGATVMTDAGAALQKASDVPADCRVSLTPDKFAALRVDSGAKCYWRPCRAMRSQLRPITWQVPNWSRGALRSHSTVPQPLVSARRMTTTMTSSARENIEKTLKQIVNHTWDADTSWRIKNKVSSHP